MKINRKNLFLALAAGSVLLLIVVKGYLSGPAPLNWIEGDRLSYSLHTSDVVSAEVPGSRGMRKRISLEGVLNMRILEVRGDVIKAAVQISPVAVKVDTHRIPDVERIYSSLFFVNISREGRFLNFEFNNEISEEDEKNIINTMRSLQCVVERGFSKTWKTEEEDANGTASVVYSAEDGIIKKKKELYKTVASADGKDSSDSGIDIKNTSFTARYNNEGSWISELVSHDLLAFRSGDNVFLKTSSRAGLKRIPVESGTGLAIWGQSLDYNEIKFRWSSIPKNKVSFAMASDKMKIRQKTGNKTFNEYIKDFFSKHIKFSSAALTDIVEYLKAFPEDSALIPDFLLNLKLNQQQRAVLTHALARAAHPEAQRALVRIMKGTGFQKENRIQAVIAFADMPVPQKTSVDSLWDTYYDRGTAGEITNTAVLSLGSISNTLGKSDDSDRKKMSDDIKSRIREDIKSAPDLNRQVALIHAASNTGDNDFIDPVSSFFKNDNPNIRSSAAASLSRLPSEKVDELLCGQLTGEDNISVRGSLVTALEKREPTEQNIKTVMDQISREDNEIVKGAMYRYLMKNRNQPGVKEKLTELKKTESSIAHRKIINRALNTNK